MNFFSFVFIVGGFIPQITISQDSTYCIGDVFTVTWDATRIHPNDVDIVLTWGTNSSWTVAEKQPNNGNASIGGDLGNSANQLSIQNGTFGQFYAVENATSRAPANNVTICQSIIFGTPGRAVQPGDHIDDIEINLRQSTYDDMGGDTADWVAYFVTVDEEKMDWTATDTLEIIPTSPTPAPTEATTTTSTSTTTTTTTTQPPQPGQPTQFFSTASPENKNNGGLSLAEALRKVSLGSQDASVEIVTEDCSRSTKDDGWCTVTVSVKVPDNAKYDGPLDLAIGVKPTNSTENDPLQYYGVNSNDDGRALTTQFLTYNSSKVDISWDWSKDRMNNTIFKYERVPMKVTLDGDTLDSNVPLYIVAVRHRFARDDEYLLECGVSRTADEYDVFGWKTILDDKDTVVFYNGSYHFEMYWAVDDFDSVLQDADSYQLGGNLMEFYVDDDKNGTVEAPVTLKDLKYERSEKAQSVSFETSFNSGTVIYGYITQCNVTCNYIGNSSFNFTTEEGGSGKAEVIFSKINMIDTSFKNDNTTTTMHLSTFLCDNFTILNTSIALEIGKVGGGGNNGLSAGAIVGIVCAGVLVLGLAAWWLCMKKSGSDGYRELNE